MWTRTVEYYLVVFTPLLSLTLSLVYKAAHIDSTPCLLAVILTCVLATIMNSAVSSLLPFVGFFSCSSGNPVAVPHKRTQERSGKTAPRVSPVERLLEEDGEGTLNGPQNCPRGYSQHLMAVDNECE